MVEKIALDREDLEHLFLGGELSQGDTRIIMRDVGYGWLAHIVDKCMVSPARLGEVRDVSRD